MRGKLVVLARIFLTPRYIVNICYLLFSCNQIVFLHFLLLDIPHLSSWLSNIFFNILLRNHLFVTISDLCGHVFGVKDPLLYKADVEGK